jgi:hypothetical protein
MSQSKQQIPKLSAADAKKNSAFDIRKFSFIRQLLIGIVVVCAISMFFFYLNRSGLPFNWEAFLDFAFSSSIGVSLWVSMGLLNSKIAPKVDWLNKPWKALLLVLPANIITAAIAITLVQYIFVVLVYGVPFDTWLERLGIGDYLISVLIGLFISAIYQGAWFIRLWKKSIVEQEQLKTSQAAAQYEVLNAQVNPHFLFNSLNVLSNLVRTNPDKAEDFIHGLSNVYRYVLDIRKEEAVLLTTEVEALSNYSALVKTRFGDRITIDNKLYRTPTELATQKLQAGNWSDKKIVPLALQMLVENAVKHNGATQKNPLYIKLFIENDWIVVTNNRPPRFEKSEGKGVGLENIRERYQLLVDKEIIIEDTDESFTVKLPLI